MPERPARPGRIGSIDGESTRFVTHHLDPEAGTITITAVQRGTRSLERLQRAITQERMTVTLPDDPRHYVTTPGTIDVTTTGAGEQAFHRARLVLHLANDVHQSQEPVTQPTDEEMPDAPANGESVEDRLNRIEAKLDHILSLLELMQKTP